jgi:adenylyl- and sulfurtransferase ThiI
MRIGVPFSYYLNLFIVGKDCDSAMEVIIIRYAELGLKGSNRGFFERRLVKNIKLCLKNNALAYASVRRIRGRILVDSGIAAIPFLKSIFGISTLSHATVVPLELEEIKKAALDYARQRKFGSFRITTQKLNVKFPHDTPSVDRIVGEVIFETMHKRVDLHKPELNLHIELADQAYIFDQKIEGPKGLPVGSEGRILCIMEGKGSYLAAVLMMKRGCSVLPCGKEDMDLELLKKYYPSEKLVIKKIKDYSELDRIAAANRIKAVVAPDTLFTLKDYGTALLVLRPLVGYSDKELEEKYKEYFG